MSATGNNLDSMKLAAARRDFKPVPLQARASATLKNTIRRIESRNVVGKLEGGDPKLKDEYVIYTAHWDHLGVGIPDRTGDKIYNGALDNATGIAALIELARSFKTLSDPPRRSMLFLAVTAEEKGLLGSQFYAEQPIYPLERTVAVINMDVMNVRGRTRDVIVVGLGNSTLDDVIREAAASQGRVLKPDAEPEKGFYYRSDHFSFAKKGVPALYADSGNEVIGKPEGWGLQKAQEYTRKDYHKPSDEIKPDWDLSGMVEDVRLLFMVGYEVSQTERYPEWSPGTEFKALREETLKKAGT
jgi:Zn-dependent M28 family amino/carboxypeptidase